MRPRARKSGCLCVNMRLCALMTRGALLGNTLAIGGLLIRVHSSVVCNKHIDANCWLLEQSSRQSSVLTDYCLVLGRRTAKSTNYRSQLTYGWRFVSFSVGVLEARATASHSEWLSTSESSSTWGTVRRVTRLWQIDFTRQFWNF